MAPAHPRLWGSPAASAQRSALFLNWNKGNMVRLSVLKEHLFLLQSHFYFCQIHTRQPCAWSFTRAFSYFLIPDCFLLPPGFSLRLLLVLSRCIRRLKSKKTNLSKKRFFFDWHSKSKFDENILFLHGLQFIRQIPQRQEISQWLHWPSWKKETVTNRNHIWKLC